MDKRKKDYIDINKIIKDNPNIKPSELAKNLDFIGKMRETGLNLGPDYTLVSPYERPRNLKSTGKNFGPILRPE